jgi:outer membrane receptor protein involved in Fe transport
MKYIYSVCLMLIFAVTVKAQVTVQGTVYAKNKQETLPGVTIIVKGSATGTTTDLDGKFNITVKSDDTLKFSYIGYFPQVIPLQGKQHLDVFMEVDNKLLDEVVVVGYGVQKKSDVTGSLVSLSGDEMQETHQQNIASIMQGRAAGVTVTSNSGAPGREEEINIRGISSINGSPPLWVVDGVPTSASVNPKDIESMEILKDASAMKSMVGGLMEQMQQNGQTQ